MKLTGIAVAMLLAGVIVPAAAEENWITGAARAVEPQVIQWRHQIHQYPELGNQEVNTARLVAETLQAAGIDVRSGVAGTGVVGVLKGAKPGPVMALRADMDALPVKEQTGLPFASRAKGVWMGKEVDVMHACGHDAHTAMLLGAAQVLAQHRDRLAGSVVFLFQPAEEGHTSVDIFDDSVPSYGARAMMEAGALSNPPVEVVFGLHLMARMPSGQLAWKTGPVLNSSDYFRISLEGEQSHGSAPWTGSDAITAAGQVINALQTLVSRRADLSQGMGVVSIGSIHGGAARNIIPGNVLLEGTIRASAAAVRDTLTSAMPPLVQQTAAAHGVRAQVRIAQGVPVTVNHPGLTQAMLPALARASDNRLHQLPGSLSPGDDFAWLAREVPGLYLFLGATPPDQDINSAAMNHSPAFYVDDATLLTGVRTHIELVMHYPAAKKQLNPE